MNREARHRSGAGAQQATTTWTDCVIMAQSAHRRANEQSTTFAIVAAEPDLDHSLLACGGCGL
jgi:hypothetical protein